MPIERRAHPRVRGVGVRSPLGEVTDVSAGGMMLFCKRRPAVSEGETLTLAVAYDGTVRQVRGVVRRIDPVGPRGVEVGLTLDEAPVELLDWLHSAVETFPYATTGARVWRAA